MRRLVSLCALLVAGSTALAAVSATLTWTPSPDPRAIGTMLVYGTASGTYTQSIDAGAEAELTVSGLVRGQTYYFAVYAYSEDLQSDYSNEVHWTAVLPRPGAPTHVHLSL
jgi:hypothetical protein